MRRGYALIQIFMETLIKESTFDRNAPVNPDADSCADGIWFDQEIVWSTDFRPWDPGGEIFTEAALAIVLRMLRDRNSRAHTSRNPLRRRDTR